MSGRGSHGTASTRWSVPGGRSSAACMVQAVIADIYAGRPVGYSTFLAYDEVAHHSGVERSDTLSVLRRVDRQIGRIAAAARDAPRPYRSWSCRITGSRRERRSSTATGSRSRSWSSAPAMPRTSEPNTQTNEALSYLNASLTELGVRLRTWAGLPAARSATAWTGRYSSANGQRVRTRTSSCRSCR